MSLAWAALSAAQQEPEMREFSQSKQTVQAAIREMQASLSGRLPVLDGFATSDRPLDSYRHGFYQSNMEVTPTSSGGARVRVSIKITAWYADPVAARSGYRTLGSNGRLESDLLDQLGDQLAKKSTLPASSPTPASTPRPNSAKAEAVVHGPLPADPERESPFSSSLSGSLPADERAALQAAKRTPQAADPQLQAEVKDLSEILKNQAHPENLVAVKNGTTPVYSTPDPNAKPLFYASAHDEFEMLDFSRSWIHVRISGLSRGWIWRDSVEMPENFPDNEQPQSTKASSAFRMVREETVPFPGDWEPLRGKTVKLISFQKNDEGGSGNTAESNADMKLDFALSLFDKGYAESTKGPQDLGGVVLIFDAADGGMIAATTDMLKKWEAGDLTDSTFWHECFFDPPEITSTSGSSASK